MQTSWFYRNERYKFGPLTWEQLVAATRVGRLKPTDVVRQGDGEWVTAESVEGLFSQAETPAVKPPEKPPAPPKSKEPAAFEPTMEWDITSGGSASAGSASDDSASDDSASESSSDHFDILEEPGSSSGLAGSGVGGATSVIRRLQPGSLLGNYEILETIGQGGMGTVLKARHLRMDRLVALKVLRTQSTKQTGAIQRFQQEVRAASRLTHPNIVTAHDADEVNGIHFLVMECVDGVDLDELLAERKRLPYKEAVEYVVQVANGLAYAHREGVVHRDIKPGNLMLDQRNTIKIMDMGLASIKETTTEQARQQESAQVTQADQILGTFDYMAPEQGEDAHSADHRADIYSLGCTLFKLVTGKAPYSGATTIQKIFAHREHPIPTMSKLCAEVPFDLDAVFGKMVAKDPGMRYQSMEEVVTDLQACLKSEPISAWQTGKWGQSESDGGQSLVHDETLRIEPSSSDNDLDEYTLSPVADEQVPEKRKQRQESDTKKAEAERTKETQPRWFWRVMGEEIGPFTLAKLKQENINTLDELRREDSDQWVVAQDVEGLFD